MNKYILLFNFSYIRILFGYELYINYAFYFLFFLSLITQIRSLNKRLFHIFILACSLIPLQVVSNGSFLQSGLLSLSLISCIWIINYLNKNGLTFSYYLKQTKLFLLMISPIVAVQLALDPNQLYILGPPSNTIGVIVVVMLFGNTTIILGRIFSFLLTVYAKTRAVSLAILIAFRSKLWFKFLIATSLVLLIILNLFLFKYTDVNQRLQFLLLANKAMSGRIAIWEAHLTYFLNECLYLVGCGPTNADKAVVMYKEFMFVDNIKEKIVNSHNTYLGLIVDYGFFGVCVLGLILKNCLERALESGRDYFLVIIVIGFVLFFTKASSTLFFAVLILLAYTNSKAIKNHAY